MVEELYKLPKLFLTPDADDWNPHCHTFGDNEESILDSNSEMADCRHNSDNVLLRQYTTNNRILRYKRFESTFYMETKFAN